MTNDGTNSFGSMGPAGQSSVSGTGPSDLAEGRQRDRFSAQELAVVLSHYDIGKIDAVKEFHRGSRRSPKLVVQTPRGMYLLKRRAQGKDDPMRVAFSHALQRRLLEQGFPLPPLLNTRDGQSALQWRDRVYELFEYVRGSAYDNSLEGTSDAGRLLGVFHRLLVGYEPEQEGPQGSYHATRAAAKSLDAIPKMVAVVDPRSEGQAERIDEVVSFLRKSYDEAAMRANDLGLGNWPMQIVHCDWHPGNMLFRNSRVVSVMDYDAARLQQRVIDVANGALQFSIIGGGEDAAQWPAYLDESRFKRFLRAYDAVPECVLSRAELRTVPWLMIEALITESVIPIAATGSFAQMSGVGFLLMVDRKVRWLQEHAEELAGILDAGEAR